MNLATGRIYNFFASKCKIHGWGLNMRQVFGDICQQSIARTHQKNRMRPK